MISNCIKLEHLTNLVNQVTSGRVFEENANITAVQSILLLLLHFVLLLHGVTLFNSFCVGYYFYIF
jgi:hypothetical protein